jgi:hypothetical protein
MAKKNAGSRSSALGTEPGPVRPLTKTLGTEPKSLSGLWKRGTEPGRPHKPPGTTTLKLDMQPGDHPHLQPGEERVMKVRLSKAKVKGKTVLKLSLEG